MLKADIYQYDIVIGDRRVQQYSTGVAGSVGSTV